MRSPPFKIRTAVSGTGRKAPPEIVHGVTVEAPSAPQQLGWIDHVRRAALMDVDLDLRVLREQ